MECSCRLWPTPGIYVVTSIPLVSRTRATFRSAELGFFGVEVYTRVQTPRFCGQLCNAGLAVFHRGGRPPVRRCRAARRSAAFVRACTLPRFLLLRYHCERSQSG